MTIITKEQALEMIKSVGNDIFGVEFFKADNSYRKMSCRLHCQKAAIKANKTGRKHSPNKDRFKVRVYDMGVKTEDGQGAFRTISVDRLTVLRIGGKVFEVEG